jgi:hypothetical protein
VPHTTGRSLTRAARLLRAFVLPQSALDRPFTALMETDQGRGIREHVTFEGMPRGQEACLQAAKQICEAGGQGPR